MSDITQDTIAADDGLSRRQTLRLALLGSAAALLPPGALPAAAQAAAPPRNRTMILVWGGREGRWADFDLWNPYAIGSNHQNGPNMVAEPLAYYSAFADKTYMWLAESYNFSADFKQLTIKTRSGIKWSDGKAFSAEDVAYTLNSLRDLGPKVRFGVDVQQAVAKATATDANTVVVDFKIPSPRFFFFMTYKYDIGVYIVPKHIFEGQDWTTFKHFDVAKGWPVTTGPWRVTNASPQQKVLDRADTWWAADAKLAPMPQVLRNVWLPFAGEQAMAQAMITNQVDAGSGLQPATFPTVFRQNAKVITHSGQKPPYGYLDWWPISLYLNNEVKPFDQKEVRWAVSYYIDREQLIDIGYLGAGAPSMLPLPPYKPLQPYIDAVKDKLAKYNTNEHDTKKGDALLTSKGFKKGADGFWADATGKKITIDIIGFGASGPALGPVLVEMMKRNGIEASIAVPPDFDDRFSKGQFTGAIYGHGGSIAEPYNTLKLYQSSSVAVPGGHQVNFARWKSAEYDKIVDEMFAVAPSDTKKLTELWIKAMDIWLPELPDVQLVQNIHRIPYSTQYWKNWPTADNAYVNGAHWHLTFPMVLWNLQPVS
ncbi:MAG: ABC transporter substrate-binding protein [Alphaproteobacteria bacterium]|nr:ABC transporter substrate-binding protein [Alphaproteobacteria bacterium]